MSCSCSRAPSPPAAAAPVDERDFSAQDAYRQPAKVLAALPVVEGKQVADIGAGGGYFALKLARLVGPRGQVIATDLDPAALAALAARAQRAGLGNVTTRRVAPEDPGLEPGRYAALLLSEVDHLLVNRVDYFRRLRFALSWGAVIVVVNHERHGAACRAALAAAGFAVEELVDRPPGQVLLRARLASEPGR